MTGQHSCLGATLTRCGQNDWVWSDGTPEPRVTDLSASHVYNFRCRTVEAGTFVEVLLSVAHSDCGTLVPIGEWDDWSRDHPYGATWGTADESEILAKAGSLGWHLT